MKKNPFFGRGLRWKHNVLAAIAVAALCLAGCEDATTTQRETHAIAELMRIAPYETRVWVNVRLDLQAAAPDEWVAYADKLFETGEDESFYALVRAAPDEAARFFLAMAILIDIAPLEVYADLAGIRRGKLNREVRQQWIEFKVELSKRAVQAREAATWR